MRFLALNKQSNKLKYPRMWSKKNRLFWRGSCHYYCGLAWTYATTNDRLSRFLCVRRKERWLAQQDSSGQKRSPEINYQVEEQFYNSTTLLSIAYNSFLPVLLHYPNFVRYFGLKEGLFSLRSPDKWIVISHKNNNPGFCTRNEPTQNR